MRPTRPTYLPTTTVATRTNIPHHSRSFETGQTHRHHALPDSQLVDLLVVCQDLSILVHVNLFPRSALLPIHYLTAHC